MKTIVAVAFALVATLHASAQTRLADATNAAAPVITSKLLRYEEGQRGPHQKVWHKVTETARPDGSLLLETNVAYVELATGLHYEQDGRWLEAEELIEAYPGGAVARQGQHKVIWAGDLATAGAVDMELPSGRRLRSHLLGISYFDTASGKGLMVAQVTNCTGRIESGNRVVYPQAFDTLSGSVVYTYTRSSLEQDVEFHEPLVNPVEFSMSPETTVVELITEFMDEARPVVRGLPTGDQELDFGGVKMVAGKAFRLGQSPGGKAVAVRKQWRAVENRQFLVEQIPFLELEKMLSELPKAEGAAVRKSSRQTQVASKGWKMPPRPGPGAGTNRMEVAQLSRPRQGVVVDYLAEASSATNFVFASDTTYYVSGQVNLSGTTVIEGGCVIKFTNTTVASLVLGGPVVCKTGPFRPVVLTSMHDDTVATTISGSTGSPPLVAADWTGGGLPTYLSIASPDGLTNGFQHLRFRYAGAGIGVGMFLGTVDVRHSQFLHCRACVRSGNMVYGVFNNVLMSHCAMDGDPSAWSIACFGSHVTADAVGSLHGYYDLYNVGWVYYTNSVFRDIGGWIGLNPSDPDNWNPDTETHGLPAAYTTGGGGFQSVGAGNYYLASSSPFRNAGTTNISPYLLAELRQMTTYPPVVYSNQTVILDTDWSPQATRDTDGLVDLGYHYSPVDFLVSAVIFENCKLTIRDGTVVAYTDTSGLVLMTGAEIDCAGTPTALNRFADYRTVQEQPLKFGTYPPSCGTPVNPARMTGGTPAPGRFAFTSFNRMARGGSAGYDLVVMDYWRFSPLEVRDCAFQGGAIYLIGNGVDTLTLANNLFDRELFDVTAEPILNLRNNLFRGGRVSFDTWSTNIMVRDNAFDGATVDDSFCSPALTHSHNAYVNGAGRLTPTNTYDKVLASFSYVSGPLGDYYQPTNSVLIDAGSQSAAAAGLYHYTTTTNQVKDSSTVDIGVHYVAVDGTGLPVDTDGDGLPDYWEDVNGNGTADSGEASWLTSPNGTTGQSGLRVYTPLK